jgi:asparagine synthase (glutamine-hydrolysing)
MCGIFVAIEKQLRGAREEELGAALDRLYHRGPDNADFWRSDRVLLGHTRLAIVDIGTGANQPYCFEHLVLSYNGEVFNYIELRELLRGKNYEFDTDSDTEVVIKAFHCFGAQCFALFNGMWALAIYDRRSDETILCRDRFGQKPLFITADDESFLAASELQALAPLTKWRPNFSAIRSFLLEGDFDVGNQTFFDNIFEFPKASYMRLQGSRIVEVQRYWDYPSKGSTGQKSNEEFHQLFRDAVRLRLRSDVDYCLLLSGGCDSTLVSGITRELVGETRNLAAFTYASGDGDDESIYAQSVARSLGIALTVVKEAAETHDYVRTLSLLVNHLGRGHSSPAIVSVYRLYREIADRGYKVALDGQGADELLAGYRHYHVHLIIDKLRHGRFGEIPALVVDLFKEGVPGVLVMAMRNSLPAAGKRLLRKLYGYESLFSGSFRSADSHLHHPLGQAVEPPASYSLFDRYLHRQHSAGLTNLLYYGDIVAMANSVENRSPFMDHRLVELAFRAESELKVVGGVDKAVLRSHPIYRRFSKLLDRKKVGFNSPINLETRQFMIDQLTRSEILKWPIFDAKSMHQFLASDRALASKYERFIFRLFQTHLWNESFMVEPCVLPELAAAT